jgi:hypothetical protein
MEAAPSRVGQALRQAICTNMDLSEDDEQVARWVEGEDGVRGNIW